MYIEESHSSKGLLDTFNPSSIKSTKYVFWHAILDPHTCFRCLEKHGKIYYSDQVIVSEPPLHYNCRCEIWTLRAIHAGQATKKGNNGADYWLKYFGDLPRYYITKEDAYLLGWRNGKSPSKYAQDKMITCGVYANYNSHLPVAAGRIWYEADINYYKGRRNGHRIVWSNDGLIFVTYDHYATFYEII